MNAISPPVISDSELDKATNYLSATREVLVDSVRGLSDAQSAFKPAQDQWSIAEIVEHVYLIESRVHIMVEKMGDAPPPPPGWEQAHWDEFIPAEIPNRGTKVQAPPHVFPVNGWSGGEALERFLEAREKTIQLLSSLLLRGHVLPHPIFGPWEGYQWLLATAAHSARHAGQISEVKADPQFPHA